jgi:hypothetical protein
MPGAVQLPANCCCSRIKCHPAATPVLTGQREHTHAKKNDQQAAFATINFNLPQKPTKCLLCITRCTHQEKENSSQEADDRLMHNQTYALLTPTYHISSMPHTALHIQVSASADTTLHSGICFLQRCLALHTVTIRMMQQEHTHTPAF